MATREALMRAQSWADNGGLRPEPAKAKVVAMLLLEHISNLSLIATGQVRHRYNGQCPDAVEGPHVRDPDCPACRILLSAGQ